MDGRVVTEPGTRADPTCQRIEVDGRAVRPERFEYLLLNKPAGFLCTSSDPRGRPTFHNLLPPLGVRLVSAGRLDYDSEGLLLVTNDGNLIQSLIHPRVGVEKVYVVDLDGPLSPADRERFLAGILIDGETHRALAVRPRPAPRGGHRYELVLKQGLNRQIRRMAEAVGRRVLRLQRIRLGPLELGDLPSGGWRRLRPDEVLALRNRPAAAACVPVPSRPRMSKPRTGAPGRNGRRA